MSLPVRRQHAVLRRPILEAGQDVNDDAVIASRSLPPAFVVGNGGWLTRRGLRRPAVQLNISQLLRQAVQIPDILGAARLSLQSGERRGDLEV